MTSYGTKLEKKKFRNWVKAQLAVLITKEGIEPFVCNEIQTFQLNCLDKICYNNRLISGTICSSCCTENLIKCPSKRICNVKRGECSYHRNSTTQYNPAGCPNRICIDFNKQIECAHRYYGPSYKNTDATQWCSNPWEIAKCFMPPDGYVDKQSATDTDFNGIISVIINYKEFELKVNAKLNSNNNIFEEAKDICRRVRHSSSLELEDKELQQCFKVLQSLLSDPGYLSTDIDAQEAKLKLLHLENDRIMISNDDVDRALSESAEARRRRDIQIRLQQYSVEEDDEYFHNKQKLKKDLITLYKTNYSTLPLSPLVEEIDTPLVGFYIMPEIDMQTDLFRREEDRTRVKSFEDIFLSGNKVAREIYLSADAGFGKTAFSKYLVMAWSQTHLKDENCNWFKDEELQILSEFAFVFLVFLRDSTNVCHIDFMIEQGIMRNLPCSSSLPNNFLHEILRIEKCLIILDGLDEWTHPKDNCTIVPKSIPHRFARENCVTLTTTRPWKLGDVNLRMSQTDKIIELVQLNDETAEKLIKNGIQKVNGNLDEDKVMGQTSQLLDVIRDRDLNDLKTVPLLLMYMICLWCDDKPIGETKCQVYTGIIELLLTRFLKRFPNLEATFQLSQVNLPRYFKTLDICKKFSSLIAALGKLAFHTLFSDQRKTALVFDRSTAEKYLGTEKWKKFCLMSGILTESTVKRLTERNSRISFSHKTIQEYFCAIHISGKSLSDGRKTIVDECRSVQHVLDKSTLLMFITGMNPDIISSVSFEIMPLINNDKKTSTYRTMAGYDYRYVNPLRNLQNMYMSCANEVKNDKDFKLCLQDVFINCDCQQASYFKQLIHVCQQNKEYIKSIL